MTLHVAIAGTERPPAETIARISGLKRELESGRMVPYLGPDLLTVDAPAPVPTAPETLALALHAKVAVSGRIRGNLWSTAQFIEARRHRKTLTALMAGAFDAPATPSRLHRALAALPLPLIVDTWYDGAMRTALADSGRTDWAELQGVTRAAEFRDIWTRAYGPAGGEIAAAAAAGAATVLYKPHGAVAPARNFLVSDADYVEVLTEIDIQTPIPQLVKERRDGRPFLFIGNRFHDQMLRTFARQIAKRSADGHVAIVEGAHLTRNEARFLAETGIEVIDCPLGVASGILAAE